MTTSGSLPCLGSGCSISTRQFEKSISIVGRVSTRKSFSSFGRVCVRRRWRYVSVCKYSVTTEIIDDLKSSISHESTFIGSSDDDDLLLRRAPKPVSKSASKDKSVLGMDLLPWDPSNLSEDSQEYGSINGEEEEIRNMDESLGEVLEKAERLETGKKISLPVKNSPSNTRTERNGRRVSSNAIQKSNYVNVVWQKGDPTATTSKDKSVSGTDLLPCHPSNLSEDSQEYRSKNGEEEGRQNVVDSSGEVLEKAERLETGKKISLPVKNSPSSTRTEPRNGRRVSSDAIRKSNYVNGVWQKGDPVAATQKAFEESPKIEKIIEKQEPRTEVVGKVESLGEVLEKAERLETGKKISLPVKNSPSNTRSEPRNGRRVSSDAIRKSNYVNIVWQKGDPVAATRKAVEESPNIEKIIEKQEPRREIVGKVESLGEVLEKAERLETGKKISLPIKNSPSNTRTEPRNGGRVGSNANRESNYVNIVWQKGDLVATTRKAVEESPNIEKIIEKQEPRTKVVGKVNSQPVSPLRPLQPLQKDQSKLQPKPSTAPPAAIGKSFILKDVGAAPRPSVTDDAELHSKTEEHKPILIDRFANQKSVIDPPVAQAVLVPLKPVKGGTSNSNKFKNVFRNKSSSSAGQRRRIVDVVGIPDEEEASELNVSIRGASIARKGRKWNKACRKAARLQADREAAPVKVEILEVGEEGMLTEELAYNLAISEGKILGSLYSKGIKPDGVQTLSKDMVKMICKEHEVEVIDAAPVRVEEMAKKNEILDEDDLDKLEDRPPVLTIMGHVDHGKTTLLDYIRKSKVAASEAGGITQGIGAYKVQVPIDGKWQPCVFLDTPGHEAFGAMRARGARVTDIAIIVVAADDGIRPQTNEAVAHAKAAGVPIVIAINKIDKEGANPERVMEELSSIGVIPEAWGGAVPMVKISALKGENIDDLLETVMLVAELQELKANPHKYAKGTAIEAGMDKSKGPLATFLVQNGTLKRGDVVVCGEGFGKVRALFDDNGKRVDEAGPSIPVQVIGLNNVPLAGDEFGVVCSLDVAREKAELRAESIRNERISAKAGDGKITLSSLASAVSSGKHAGLDLHQLNIIMKVDVQGSIEAIRQALQVLPQDNVTLKFLLQATGDVSRSDVDLASASKAIIFGFNVRAPGSVKSHSDNKGVEIRLYKVIYDLIDDVRYAMEGLLEPVEDQVPIGSAEVRATFSSGSGRVAGCMVTEGKVVKECGIRVLRKGKAIFIGTLDSLKRVKESVKEVNTGLECGIGIDDFSDWEVGDTIETFNTVQKKRTLEEASASIAAALEEVGIKL